MAKPECPHCGGTGWKVVEGDVVVSPARETVPAVAAQRPEAEGVKALALRHKQGASPGLPRVAVRCECAQVDRHARVLARARIPSRYEHCDFENFDTDLYEGEPEAAAWNRSLEQAKVVVESFAREYPLGVEHGLLIMGPCGAGKTHLAVAALKQLALRGHDGLFYDYWELLKEIQASYNPVNQTTEMGVLEPVLTTELLLLDDLGASKPSAWALETVGYILKTRYNEKRVTLLTTHYRDCKAAQSEAVRPPSRQARPSGKRVILDASPQPQDTHLPSGQAVPAYRDETLSERVGEHIRSRLYEMCRTVELVAPDYRKEIRQAGRVRS